MFLCVTSTVKTILKYDQNSEHLYASIGLFEGYLHYKTITPQNVLSEAQVKNFFIS